MRVHYEAERGENMNENNSESGWAIFCCVIMVVTAIVASLVTYQIADRYFKQKAIDARAAKWVCDPTSGVTTFTWTPAPTNTCMATEVKE